MSLISYTSTSNFSNSDMKSVCIIGAGPGGLVAAKTLLQSGQFEITVYEKKDRIGGIWALDRNSTGGILSPYTPTNLSRFTVGFSDLDWNSVDYNFHAVNGVPNGSSECTKVPVFPKAWMANRYLEAYCKRYIPEDIINCGYKVTKAARIDNQWHITTVQASASQAVRQFDYLIMASGFFAVPRSLVQDVPQLAANASNLPIRVIHSSEFRDLDQLFPEDMSLDGKRVLMLGGGNSAGETAAAVALQLSNSQWSPDTPSSKRFRDCKIVHVTPRPFYPLPPFNEYEECSRSYVPLDFKLYDFAKRPPGLGSYGGRQPAAVRDMVHGSLQAMAGGDQSDISKALAAPKSKDRGTAYVALTETYPEFVRSGLIDVVSGRVKGLLEEDKNLVSAIVEQDGEKFSLTDIAAVIYATGYTPSPALDILDDDTKAAIGFDQESMRLPMVLQQWQTMSEKASAVSFIGFYEGPYWPMMEMQARLTAQRWMTGRIAETKSYEAVDELLRMRQAMQDRNPDVPQFWFNDHLGYLDDVANELGLQRNDQAFGKSEGCTSPARFVMEGTDKSEADSIMLELHQLWNDCIINGKFVPRAAFRALQGNWNIDRTIESAMPTFPSGKLTGTASFHPRSPTADKTGKFFDLEYLYVESGTFSLSTGHTMTANRRYVYRYSEAEDTLSIWFVKPEDNHEVDYLFHNLGFLRPEEARKAGALVAKADHLCVEDMYWTEYRLPMKGIALRDFAIKHTVKGPDKDYVAMTRYERPAD